MKAPKEIPGRSGRSWLVAVLRICLLLALVLSTGAFVALVGWKIILPAYKTPTNRTYTTGFGYAAIKHRFKIPFEIRTAHAEQRTLRHQILGEGFMSTASILVPVIPTDKILAVHVAEGQFVHKGDILAELDSTRAEIKLRSAELALDTALAEEQRVEIGSAYVLAQERPEKDQIDLTAARKALDVLKEECAMFQKLEATGAVAHLQVLDLQKAVSESEAELNRSQFDLGMSSKGQPQSKLIAADSVADNRNALKQRQEELRDYKVYAPSDGVIERVLIEPGEYNQDSGKPAFILDSGLWFEAHLDQTSIGLVKPGDHAEVFLEAMPGTPIPGAITQVIPIVTYDTGGPELARPIRPSGSGAPEWPATYKLKISLDEGKLRLVPGLTGFARVSVEREALAIPRAALLSVSAGAGIVHVVNGERHQARAVTYGLTDGDWTEITSGLELGDKVITEGQLGLQAGDRIVEMNPLAAGSGKQ